jgi:predicted acyl esterase
MGEGALPMAEKISRLGEYLGYSEARYDGWRRTSEYVTVRDDSGKIGMYCRSYLGITQFFCASEAPPHLACIFPEVAWLDEYSFTYPGGIFLDWPVWGWGRFVSGADRFCGLPPDWREMLAADRERKLQVRSAVTSPPGEMAIELMGGLPDGPVPPVDADEDASQLALATAEHRASADSHAIAERIPFRDSELPEVDGSFHEQRSVYPKLEALARANVPAYHLGGWFDGFTRDTLHCAERREQGAPVGGRTPG